MRGFCESRQESEEKMITELLGGAVITLIGIKVYISKFYIQLIYGKLYALLTQYVIDDEV